MSARVKLLTVWDDGLPAWYDRFVARVKDFDVVDWELVPFPVRPLNEYAAFRLGAPCRKLTAHAQCDLRPAFGELFRERYAGYEFWGWCDLDVVLGDLDRLLPPLLDAHDVVTADAGGVAGPFTVLRNNNDLTALYRATESWREVLADPDYCNFDETGFAEPGYADVNPSLTGLLRGFGRRVHFDGRTWTETADPLPQYGVPSRGCELFRGRTLRETPTNRELLLYHFNRAPKTWPIPDRYEARFRRRRYDYWRGRVVVENPPPAPPLPDLPVTSAAYWDARVESVLAAGLPTYRTVYDGPEERWNAIQAAGADAVAANVPAGASVLDVGCGYGALWETVSGRGLTYVGVDVSPSMVKLSGGVAPMVLRGDARALPFPGDSFDWCVCRGLEGSVRVREGNRGWNRFRSEMLRVAPRALLLDYAGGAKVLRREDYTC